MSMHFAATSKVISEAEKEAIELQKEIAAQQRILSDDTITTEEELNAALENLNQERLNNKKEVIGEVYYYNHWRQYVYEYKGVMWSLGCLRDM